jgi:hypothetical protein
VFQVSLDDTEDSINQLSRFGSSRFLDDLAAPKNVSGPVLMIMSLNFSPILFVCNGNTLVLNSRSTLILLGCFADSPSGGCRDYSDSLDQDRVHAILAQVLSKDELGRFFEPVVTSSDTSTTSPPVTTEPSTAGSASPVY